MADASLQNPIVAELIDDLAGRIHDVDAVQRHLDLVRAEIAENTALYAEAVAQLAQPRRRHVGALVDAAARREPRESESEKEEEELVLDDPEMATTAAACLEIVARAKLIQQNELLLFDALGFLLVAQAFAFVFAFTRAHLLPGVLLTVAAAYALVYFASWGAVVPGPTSLLRISVLLLCFLFGVPVLAK